MPYIISLWKILDQRPNPSVRVTQRTKTKPPVPLREKQPEKVTSTISSFKCSKCDEYCMPPIVQCHFGHLVCTDCKPTIQMKCPEPSCQCPFGNVRNVALEQIANYVQFPCKFISRGCPSQKMSVEQKMRHDETCDFRPYRCPHPEACAEKFPGPKEVLRHVLSSHDVKILQGDKIGWLLKSLKDSKATNWVYVQEKHGHHFLVVVERSEKFKNAFYIVVQLIGSKTEAEKFAYSLTFNDPDTGKQINWGTAVLSIHDGLCAQFIPGSIIFGDNFTHLISTLLGDEVILNITNADDFYPKPDKLPKLVEVVPPKPSESVEVQTQTV